MELLLMPWLRLKRKPAWEEKEETDGGDKRWRLAFVGSFTRQSSASSRH